MITKQLTALFAIVCITVLGVIALNNGMDGAIMASCIGTLAGLGGYYINKNKTQP